MLIKQNTATTFVALICRQGQCCPFFEDTVHCLKQGLHLSIHQPRLTHNISASDFMELLFQAHLPDLEHDDVLPNLHHTTQPPPGLSTYAFRMHMIKQCGLLRKGFAAPAKVVCFEFVDLISK